MTVFRKLHSGLGLAMLLIPSLAVATPVTGMLNLTGDATVTASALMFLCDLVGGQPCPANTLNPANPYGDFVVTGPSAQSGTFTSLANTYGYIATLSAATTPAGPTFLLQNFITFKSNSDIVLDLTKIFPGTAPPCPGSSPCTPVTPSPSPVTFFNTPTGSTATFSVQGQTRRVSTGETAPFDGTFTAQFTNTPGTNDASIASVLSQLAANGSITTSYSATFAATAIPEPATTSFMIGGALMLLGMGFRRVSRKR